MGVRGERGCGGVTTARQPAAKRCRTGCFRYCVVGRREARLNSAFARRMDQGEVNPTRQDRAGRPFPGAAPEVQRRGRGEPGTGLSTFLCLCVPGVAS